MSKNKQISSSEVLAHVLLIASRGLGVSPVAALIEGFEDATLFNANTAPEGWVLSDGVENLATNTDHVADGKLSLKWDKKVDGADNTATISKTFDESINLTDVSELGKLIYYFKPPTGAGAANFDSIEIRLGTDASNYAEWQTLIGGLVENSWNRVEEALNIPDSFTGTGLDYSALKYIAIVLTFTGVGDADVDYFVDSMHIVTEQYTA